jgi:hypothetical protein
MQSGSFPDEAHQTTYSAQASESLLEFPLLEVILNDSRILSTRYAAAGQFVDDWFVEPHAWPITVWILEACSSSIFLAIAGS